MNVTQRMIDAGEAAYHAADKEDVPYMVQQIFEEMYRANCDLAESVVWIDVPGRAG